MPKLRKWLKKRPYQPAFAVKKPAAREHTPMATTQFDVVSEQHLVPYDENLLERSRTQWQFGDWASLAALSQDTLQHHPDRAKLALLAAAGHAQLGQTEPARQYTRLAQDWGCPKKLVAQVLISGTHNSLARAAAVSGRPVQARSHFEHAVRIGMPHADASLLTPARAQKQLADMGLAQSIGLNATSPQVLTGDRTAWQVPTQQPTQIAVDEITQTLAQQKTDLDAQLKKQADELIRMRKFLDSSLKKEVANAAKQIEAAIGLQSYFATGDLPNINVERHSWPISPDFALYLISLLETNDYDVIIEFGSGISTTIIAKTLAKMAARRQQKLPVAVLSFDHLEQYYNQTLAQLRQADLAESVQLVLAPLQPYTAPNGNTYPYYACQEALAALARGHTAAGSRVLVVVDGPPAATGKHARYPAAPCVLAAFKGAQIDFLLDDYIRDDEKEIAVLWQELFTANQVPHTTTTRQLEKDACLIRTSASSK